MPLFYLLWSLRFGDHAPDNPWGATGLEWRTSSPPPKENFARIPFVDNDPYEYHDEGQAPQHGQAIHQAQGGGNAPDTANASPGPPQ